MHHLTINGFYRLGQENAYWLRNVPLMKNPHFWWYQADILAIWPNHEIVILTKFHQNWKKIDNFLQIAHFLASTHSAAQVCRINKSSTKSYFYQVAALRKLQISWKRITWQIINSGSMYAFHGNKTLCIHCNYCWRCGNSINKVLHSWCQVFY